MDNWTHATDHQLYDKIESLISDRSIYGRGKTPEAYHCRGILNPQIAKLRRELNRRGLPSRRWIYEAQQEAQDVADLADTQQGALQ